MKSLKVKNALIFSGKGDFFSSYKKQDQLLSFILEHNVEIYLDINGLSIKEYPDLSHDKIMKIKSINLSMHYQQLKERKALKAWARNTKKLFEKNSQFIFMNTIISHP